MEYDLVRYFTYPLVSFNGYTLTPYTLNLLLMEHTRIQLLPKVNYGLKSHDVYYLHPYYYDFYR